MTSINPADPPAVLITGGGSGIGAAAAARLRRRGYRVALVGRTADKLRATGAHLGEEGRDWIMIPADVARPSRAAGAVDLTADAFGRLDALINNAGWTPMKPLLELDDDEVAAIFAVNTLGPIAAARRAVGIMAAAGGGVVVNVSSVAARDPFPGLGVYGAAKAALNTLSVAIANEYEPQGLRAFAVAPGAVETDLLRSIVDETGMPASACLTPDEVAEVIEACVTGESGKPNGSTIWVEKNA